MSLQKARPLNVPYKVFPAMSRTITGQDGDTYVGVDLASQTFTDCRTEEGITVGLIDAIITIARVLRPLNMTPSVVQEALKDLAHDEDFNNLLMTLPIYYGRVDAPPEGVGP